MVTLIHLITVIIDVDGAKIRNMGKGNGKFLTTAFKSKIIRFILDEDSI